jgi:hypothetical protein
MAVAAVAVVVVVVVVAAVATAAAAALAVVAAVVVVAVVAALVVMAVVAEAATNSVIVATCNGSRDEELVMRNGSKWGLLRSCCGMRVRPPVKARQCHAQETFFVALAVPHCERVYCVK